MKLPNGFVHGGTEYREVTLRKLKASDEDWIRTPSTTRDGSVVTRLLARVIKSLGTVTDQEIIWQVMQNMPWADVNYLLIQMRVVSFGPEYVFQRICPHCKKPGNHVVDLDGFHTDFRDSIPSPDFELEFEGDDGPTTCKLRPLTVAQGGMIEAIAKQYKQERSTRELLLQVLELGGEKPTIEVIKNLSFSDLATIREALDAHNGGMPTMVDSVCQNCETETSAAMPVGVDFFFKKASKATTSKASQSLASGT